MESYERKLYNILTNDHDESGESARLNHMLFGDDEFSGVRRAEALDKMREKMEIDSLNGMGG